MISEGRSVKSVGFQSAEQLTPQYLMPLHGYQKYHVTALMLDKTKSPKSHITKIIVE
jgi:hypothetical protein